jgi:translocator protein
MLESVRWRNLGAPARSPLGSALALAGFLAASFAAGGIGSLATTPQTAPGGWYDSLDKPFFTPPAWLFGPVWTLLFVLMAVAAWLVWRRRGFSGASVALSLFGVQLVLNALWSIVFFGLEAPGLALVEILVLLAAIVLTALAFLQVSRPAALLMAPYIAWVAFATLLNAGIWLLN